jgi:hypothetical protein
MTVPIDALAILTEARSADLDLANPTIRERIYQAAISTSTKPRPRRHAQLRRFLIPATSTAALAALVVAGLVVQPLRGTSSQPGRASRSVQADDSASAVLLAAAAVVAKTTVASLGEYWHTSMQVYDVGTTSDHSDAVDLSDWIARDPNGQSWYSMSSPKGHSLLVPAGTPSNDPYHTRFDVLDRFLSFDETQQLPADPPELEAYLLAISPHHAGLPPVSVSDRLFEAAVDVADTPAPPTVRAAAFRLLAGLPGLTSLGPVTDPLGRTGVGIENSYSGDDTEELIVDPGTGSLLALEDLSTVDGHVTIVQYEALVQAGWTNTVDASAGA